MRPQRLGVFLTVLPLIAGVFSGCQKQEAAPAAAFSLSAAEEAAYAATIDQVLSEYYWKYDAASLAFAEGEVTREPEAQNASARCDYALEKQAGRACITATVTLLYASDEPAGTGTFYFKGNNLLGFWYAAPGAAASAYSLLDRNLYPAGEMPDKLESAAGYAANRTESALSLPTGGRLVAVGHSATHPQLLCLLLERRLTVYGLEAGVLTPLAALDWETERPITAAFLTDGTLAVLLGDYVGDGSDDGGRIVSSRVAFYSLSAPPEEPEAAPEEAGFPEEAPAEVESAAETASAADPGLPEALTERYPALEAAACTGLAALATGEGPALAVFSSRSLKQYQITAEGPILAFRQYLGHSVTSMTAGDLTGDGTTEYFLISGLDCYLYRAVESGYEKIWQTHVNGSFFQGPAWMGDLNRDGVLELYLTDNYGSAIRYTLGQWGLVTRNEDIDYGEILVVADLNGDGQSDCIQQNADGGATLYLYTPATEEEGATAHE